MVVQSHLTSRLGSHVGMFTDHVWKFEAWRAIRGCEDASGGQHNEDDGAAHETSAARVRVLCCHGYASNLHAFLSRHCKDLSSQAPTAGMLELSGIDGPAIIHDSGGRQRAWWHFEPEFPMDRTRQPDFWRLSEGASMAAICTAPRAVGGSSAPLAPTL